MTLLFPQRLNESDPGVAIIKYVDFRCQVVREVI